MQPQKAQYRAACNSATWKELNLKKVLQGKMKYGKNPTSKECNMKIVQRQKSVK